MKENIQAYWQHQDASRPLNVLMIGESFCDKTYRISRSGENFLSFEYILEGEGTLVENGKTCHPGKNDVYILTRNSDHQYWADATNPWVKIWVAFNGPLAEALFDLYLEPDCPLVENCNILPYLQEMFRYANTPGTGYDDVVERVSELLLKICMHIRRDREQQKSTVAERLKEWLDLNVEASVSLGQLGTQYGYSRNRLIQLFREAYGITPYRYLRQKKIESARQFLSNTQLSVGEIAQRLSFADAQYFSGCFKAETGFSPLQYRKRQAE